MQLKGGSKYSPVVTRLRVWRFAIWLALSLAAPLVHAQDVVPTKWIGVSAEDRLVYGADAQGNKVPDFSTVGYREGAGQPPQVPVVVSIQAPSGVNDTPIIQKAIDEVSARPLGPDGFRGAVELGVGKFRLDGSLKIAASGVVLRGQGPETILVAEGLPRVLIVVGGTGTWRRTGPTRKVVDSYVPVGATRIKIDDVTGLRSGTRVIVQRPFTQTWISAIGMDQLPQRSHGGIRQWRPGPGLLFDRKILRVDNDSVVLDAALTDAMSPADEPVLWAYTFDGRVRDVGLESFSAIGSSFFGTPNYATDTYRKSAFVSFNAIEDGWARNLVISDFATAITFRSTSSHVTASDFRFSSPRNPRVRARPPVISIDGQQILVTRCQISGRHFSAWVTQSAAPGPNVVHRCSAKGDDIGAGAHQRWATGVLFDNVELEGRMHIGNRGSFGTGHGWSGANSVVWNSSTKSYLIERPPTATNWAFGVSGEILREKEPLGDIISANRLVIPSSLYEKQLSERGRTISP